MALVPQHTYMAWFSRTSLVYRAWAYWYQNPLWERPIPKGASLCPFWWMAVTSVLFLRPLVYLTLALRSLVKILRLGKLLDFTDRISPFGGERGVPTIGLVVLVLVLSLLGFVAYEGVSAALSAGFAIPSLSLPIALLTFLPCLAYASESDKQGKTDRCRVEVYVYVTLGVLIALNAIFHTTLFVDMFLLSIPKLLWMILCGIGWCFGQLWSALVWMFTGIAFGSILSWTIVGGVGAALVYGWIVSKLDVPPMDIEPARVKLTKADINYNIIYIAETIWKHEDDHEDDLALPFSRLLVDLVWRCPEALDLARSGLQLTREQVLAIYPALVALREADKAREAKRSAACKRVTAMLVTLCTPVIAVWKQIRIAGSYAWALVKARKQGLCPFIRFEDAAPSITQPSSSPSPSSHQS